MVIEGEPVLQRERSPYALSVRRPFGNLDGGVVGDRRRCAPE
jgi:hypothetical protein